MKERIVIGAGIYGLYGALVSLKNGYRVTVLEADSSGFERGSFINQARLHSGYHYPRSIETAKKSRDYFFRFLNDFTDAINTDFKQLYAISSKNSKTTKADFVAFCNKLNIKCDEIDSNKFFKQNTVDGLFDTLEYSIDCKKIYKILLDKCMEYEGFNIHFNTVVTDIDYDNNIYTIYTSKKDCTTTYHCNSVLNATYASTNIILKMLDLESLDIKYELCEVILCHTNLDKVGITVMDGDFFSLMPFNNNDIYSLTSVCHTPHETSYSQVPTYDCNCANTDNHNGCGETYLANCNNCIKMSCKSKCSNMLQLASKYLKDDITITPIRSLYTVKPILNSCELDDARPTLIKTYDKYPGFITVFSGKLNTIYDLDEVLK